MIFLPGALISVGPFDVDDEDLSVRHMNLGFGWHDEASLVLILDRAKGTDPMNGSKIWKVIVLHQNGEMKFCDTFRFPASKCQFFV